MKNNYDIILFDLDGTLSNSADGIRTTIEYTLIAMNKPVPDLSDYSLYIGPPLIDTFLNLCNLTLCEAQIAVDIYREKYNTQGKFNCKLFDGIEEVLRKLKQTDAKIAVASSKYELFTKEIVDILNISKYFDVVCGSNKSGTIKEKKDLIPYAVAELGCNMNDKIVMIGDTKFDAEGAMQTNVDFIGVSYGYGKIDDMKKYGATKIAGTPYELLNFLMD